VSGFTGAKLVATIRPPVPMPYSPPSHEKKLSLTPPHSFQAVDASLVSEEHTLAIDYYPGHLPLSPLIKLRQTLRGLGFRGMGAHAQFHAWAQFHKAGPQGAGKA